MMELKRLVTDVPFGEWYFLGECRVCITRDGKDAMFHLSISHPSRYPTFDEIKEARYRLIPDDVTMVMMFPPRGQYVNLHTNCFHLYQSKMDHEE